MNRSLKIVQACLLGLSLIFLASCTPPRNPNSVISDDQLVEVTDLKTCTGAPHNVSIYNIAWQQRFSKPNLKQTISNYYYLSASEISLTSICNEQGITVTAMVHAPIQVFGNQIQILTPQHEEVTGTGNNGKVVTCIAEIPAESWFYRLVGDCLQLNLPTKTVVLPRQ